MLRRCCYGVAALFAAKSKRAGGGSALHRVTALSIMSAVVRQDLRVAKADRERDARPSVDSFLFFRPSSDVCRTAVVLGLLCDTLACCTACASRPVKLCVCVYVIVIVDTIIVIRPSCFDVFCVFFFIDGLDNASSGNTNQAQNI